MAVPDIVAQRRNVASAAVKASTQLVDALNMLISLRAQRDEFQQDFTDTDFDGTDLRQLSAAMIGTLFDFVVPALETTYIDAGNAGRNRQILLQVRQG